MTEAQIELEELFAKNHLLPRLRREFQQPELVQHCEDHAIPLGFAVDLLAQMVLHRRATMSMLVGILHPHFGDSIFDLQACANMIELAADAGLVEFNALSWQFVLRFDVSDAVKTEIERFQYPLPMVVPPQEVETNRDTGYFTIRGSILLKDNHHDDDVCLDHINRVNRVPLVINADTARMVENQWKNLDRPKVGETREDYDARVRAFEKYDRVSREVIEAIYLIDQPFYLTHRYDKRGRCYAQGYHVTTQGNAWNKAMVEFAEREVVMGVTDVMGITGAAA